MNTNEYLSRSEAAAFLRMKTATLDVWASRGEGPGFIKLGVARSAKVLYPLSEIRRFLADPVGYRRPSRLPRRARRAAPKTPAARR